jgi:hypothetical protein
MKNIAAALVKAQKAFGPALKTHTNPAFRSKYADLSACVEAVLDALTANGIFLTQRTLECESGITVETVFLHESGEQLSSGPLHVPASKQDPQGYGSALTYARRYSLMAACGIAPEDDDGNAASKPRNLAQAGAVRHSPTQGAMEELQDQERKDYLVLLGSTLAALVDKGEVAKAYERLIKDKLDDTEYTALWEVLKDKSYVRNKLKAHGESLRKQREAAPA